MATIYTVVYRFTLSPATYYDALSFTTEHATYRIESTTGPGYSLNGAKSIRWDAIDSRAGLTTRCRVDVRNLVIKPVTGASITNATTAVTISGTVSDFNLVTGCTVAFTAALVRRPN